MHYLVATDGSNESDDAVRYAARHAVALGASLEIIHILTPETKFVNGELIVPGDDQSIELGERALEQARRLARETAADAGGELDIHTELLAGRPANRITEYADECGADAIYVGHRGLTEAREHIVGSVAKQVVSNASMPVTVIR